jgi:hypothetical protein
MGPFGRKTSGETAGASTRELTARHLQAIGRTVAGERGGQIANRVSEAIGCGTVTYCDDPACTDCAPTQH